MPHVPDAPVDLDAVAATPGIAARDIWAAVQRAAIARGDLAGWPIPAQESPLQLAPHHPLFDALNGQTLDSIGTPPAPPAEALPEPEILVNTWELADHPKHHVPCQIWLYRETAGGKTKLVVQPVRHRWAEETTKLLQTFDVAISWELKPEERAMAKLKTLVTPSAYRYYATMGAFLETSPRSQVTYVFRRLRPTLALRPDPKTGTMKILAALCMHSLAWYVGTWAGAMVPTDDVISHLLFMRGDEAKFWRYANQHQPEAREAGL